MAHVITVMVIDRNTGKGLSGHTVNLYNGSRVKTGSDGKANLTTDSIEIDVYVNGTSVYSGYASKAPRPIIYEKS